MARVGLGAAWRTLFANDFDAGKAAAYCANFGGDRLHVGDIWALTAADLPGRADLAWASSPCQDFSLAGARAGLGGPRSSALLGFWRLIRALDKESRAPRVLVIENVTGLLSSGGGADFEALCAVLADDGWRFGALEADASLFTPQSRPRVFVVATREPTDGLTDSGGASSAFRSRALRQAYAALPDALQASWLWWNVGEPSRRNSDLASLLEPDAPWDSAASTARMLELAPSLHRTRVNAAVASGETLIAAAYRRIRLETGQRVQRCELRFDGLAGCLRTPAGGSSRQFVIRVQDGLVTSRRLTAREGARLMGLPEDYRLPVGATAAWRVIGDGVAAPVVRWLAEQLLEPLLRGQERAAA